MRTAVYRTLAAAVVLIGVFLPRPEVTPHKAGSFFSTAHATGNADPAILVGRWRIVMNEELRKQVLVMEYGVQATPPTDAEMRSVGLDPSQQEQARAISTLVK